MGTKQYPYMTEEKCKRCQYCKKKLIYIGDRGGIIPHLWRCETCNRDLGIQTKKAEEEFAKLMSPTISHFLNKESQDE